jgi:hypothetical protein
MKLSIVLLILTIPCVRIASGAPMTAPDREHLIAHMEMTGSWLIDEVGHLTATQLNFRMAPDRWTIAEVVEHLVIAEPIYWRDFRAAMDKAPEKMVKQATDADILWYGIDRTRHEKTEPRKDPKGKPVDVPQGLEQFRKLHATMLDYARETSDDLRGHAFPDWGVDAYQCLLMISTHAQRHILQIREIKASSGFPEN